MLARGGDCFNRDAAHCKVDPAYGLSAANSAALFPLFRHSSTRSAQTASVSAFIPATIATPDQLGKNGADAPDTDYLCDELSSCPDFEARLAGRDWRQLVLYLDCEDGKRSIQTYDTVNFPGGYAHVYDAEGNVIGAREFTDTESGPCDALEYRAGNADFDCSRGRECFVEGVAGASGLDDSERCVDCATGALSLELMCDLVGRLYPRGQGCPEQLEEHREVLDGFWCDGSGTAPGDLSITSGCGKLRLRYESETLLEERTFDDDGELVALRSSSLGHLCQDAGRTDVAAGIDAVDCAEETTCYLCKRADVPGVFCDDAGTCPALAGSCVSEFVDSARDCVRPAGECVVEELDGLMHYCWDNGARFTAPVAGQNGAVTWRAGDAVCLHGSRLGRPGAVEYSLLLDADPSAPELDYSPDSGEGSCDGKAFSTQPIFDGCPHFEDIVAPDVSRCVPGQCP